MSKEEETRVLVESVFARIKAKTFGCCEECDGVIAKKRLEAIPFASMCIRCAEKMESGGYGRPRQPR